MIHISLTIVAFLFIVSFVWFGCWMAIDAVANVVTPQVNALHDESWTFYGALNLAETFMANFWLFLLALAVFGLAYWVYIYSQQRGQPYY